jgi:hypothetical protein
MATWVTWLGDAAKRTAFGWDAALCGLVVSRIGEFTEALAAYQADNSSGNLLAKNEAKKAAIAAMRAFANTSVRFNTKMTDIDRLALGIHPRDTTPSATAAPTTVPLAVKVMPLTGQQVQIHFKDENSAKSEAVPKGYDGAILNYTWGPEKIEDKALIKERRLMKASPFILKDLPSEAERSYLSFYLQWQLNADGAEGPKGPVEHVVVT